MIIGKSNETSWEERGGGERKKEKEKERFGRGNEGVGVKWIKCYGREIFESSELSLQILSLSLSL